MVAPQSLHNALQLNRNMREAPASKPMERSRSTRKEVIAKSGFPALFKEAFEAWRDECLEGAPLNAPREHFAQQFNPALVVKTVDNWAKGEVAPKNDARREEMLDVLAHAPSNKPRLAALARVCMLAQGIRDVEKRMARFDPARYPRPPSERRSGTAAPHPAKVPPVPAEKDAKTPAAWTATDDSPRLPGLASITATAPRVETTDARSIFAVSVSLGSKTVTVPDEGAQPGFSAKLDIIGEIEIAFRGENAQLVQGTQLGYSARPAPDGLKCEGGVWKIDLAKWRAKLNELMVGEVLAEMRRLKPTANVHAELRCEVLAIHVGNLPDNQPSTTTAILRRLQQFANANLDGDKILMAWSRLDHKPE